MPNREPLTKALAQDQAQARIKLIAMAVAVAEGLTEADLESLPMEKPRVFLAELIKAYDAYDKLSCPRLAACPTDQALAYAYQVLNINPMDC